MQHLSISDVRRNLPSLAQQSDTFTLTKRGQNIATVRVFAEARFDIDKAKQAGERIAALAARAKVGKLNCATSIIRKLRDGA